MSGSKGCPKALGRRIKRNLSAKRDLSGSLFSTRNRSAPAQSTTAALCTRLWLASGWGCPDQRLSRARRNLGTQSAHYLYRPLTLGRGLVPNEPTGRAAKVGRDRGERQFLEIQPRLLCLAACASRLGREGTLDGN